jgi:hypothetical protein
MSLLDPSGRRRLLSRLAVLPTLGLVACSLIYDLSGVQCTETADCQALGAGTVCENSLCVTPEPADGSGGGGGEGGGGSPACTTNDECIEASYGDPAICRAGSCIPLKLLAPTAQCPAVLGLGENLEYLRKPDPIIIGAYAPIGFNPAADPVLQNYEFAINQMNRGSNGGISGGSGGSKRPFIAVVCKAIDVDFDADLEASMDHLVNTLEVPAIISALNAPELEDTFSTIGHPKNVFFMSPLDADTNLTFLDDDGLLWHMLGEGRDVAPGYLALVPEIEEWIHAQHGLAPTDPIKLALVDADDQFLIDISSEVVEGLEYNDGLSAFQNEANGHFTRIRTESAAFGDPSVVAPAVQELLSFAPDVIVSMGSHESLQLIRDLEISWAPLLGPKPFYVVSPAVFGAPALTSDVGVPSEVHSRMLGVNFAAAEDSTLYDAYLSELKSIYAVGEDGANLEGKENFYDAAYFVMYAIAAVGNAPRLTGKEVASGMLRLINPDSSAELIRVGYDDVPKGLLTLSMGFDIELMGTLGPPEFNQGTGARTGIPSVYCVDAQKNRIEDALRYDPDTGMLTGSQACVPAFPPP